VSKKDIVDLIRKFNKSFDTKDWLLMRDCLAEKIEIDYESLRGTPKKITTSSKYISDRKKGLANLRTIHKSKDFEIRRFGDEIHCSCNFVIERYWLESEVYFHSYGVYKFVIKLINETLKIVKITQLVEKNEGDKKIHGAFQ